MVQKKLISKTKLFTNKESSNFISICYFGENQSKISGATSTSPEFAKFKSVIEAFERSRTELLHVDFVGTANSLIGKEHLDPQANNPLSIAQIKKMEITRFNNELVVPWTIGKKKQMVKKFSYLVISYTILTKSKNIRQILPDIQKSKISQNILVNIIRCCCTFKF